MLALGLVGGAGDVWLIYAVTFGYGFLGYVTSAAGTGLVRDLLDDDQLASGNGVLSTIDQGMRLLSPLAGAAVYAVFGGFAIAVLTATALAVAAVITTTVRVDETPPTAAADRERFWPELTAGARHIRRVPVLARLTLAMAVAFCVTGLANTTIFAAIDQGLGRGSSFFGVLAAIQGGGSVLGGITAAAVVRRLGETHDDGAGRGPARARARRRRRADDAHRDGGLRPRRRDDPVDDGRLRHAPPADDAGAGCRAGCRRRRTWR